MKKIGTLGYIILGLITTSAFAQTTPAGTTASAPAESAQTAQPAKGKKGGKKHRHHHHKKHKQPAVEHK